MAFAATNVSQPPHGSALRFTCSMTMLVYVFLVNGLFCMALYYLFLVYPYNVPHNRRLLIIMRLSGLLHVHGGFTLIFYANSECWSSLQVGNSHVAHGGLLDSLFAFCVLTNVYPWCKPTSSRNIFILPISDLKDWRSSWWVTWSSTPALVGE